MPRSKREDNELAFALNAWTIREQHGLRQRSEASIITAQLAAEEAYVSELYQQSQMFNEMETRVK